VVEKETLQLFKSKTLEDFVDAYKKLAKSGFDLDISDVFANLQGIGEITYQRMRVVVAEFAKRYKDVE
jgi:hypothetical protein